MLHSTLHTSRLHHQKRKKENILAYFLTLFAFFILRYFYVSFCDVRKMYVQDTTTVKTDDCDLFAQLINNKYVFICTHLFERHLLQLYFNESVWKVTHFLFMSATCYNVPVLQNIFFYLLNGIIFTWTILFNIAK